MSGENAFRVEGKIVAMLANGTYHVALANGHRLTAFVLGKKRSAAISLGVDDRVQLHLSPYDLSVGRIILEQSAIL